MLQGNIHSLVVNAAERVSQVKPSKETVLLVSFAIGDD